MRADDLARTVTISRPNNRVVADQEATSADILLPAVSNFPLNILA